MAAAKRRPLGVFARERRRLARTYGKWALEALHLARPANLAGDKWVDQAYKHARAAFHEAGRAIDHVERVRQAAEKRS